MAEELQLRQYLLGQLPATERDALEERLFTEQPLFALLEAMEAELMDDYAAGTLSRQESLQWEAYMSAHPDSAKRLSAAAALHRRFKPRTRWWMPALAAAAILILGIFLTRRSPEPIPVAAPVIVAVTLTPGGVRSATDQVQWVDIPRGATVVRVTWKNNAAQVFIRHIDTGKEVWRGPILGRTSDIPASLLPPGDYVATTTGTSGEELDDYTFRTRH